MATARLTQLDILHLLTILDDRPVEEPVARKLTTRGLCRIKGDQVFVSPQGLSLLKKAGVDHEAMKAGLKSLAQPKELSFAGYDFTSGPGGTSIRRELIDTRRPGDYGADPLGDGHFRMVPSGDIVDFDERQRRLKKDR